MQASEAAGFKPLLGAKREEIILDRESLFLAQVHAALQRIDAGEFCNCLECGEPISPQRLAAVPWASYCLDCQELHDARDALDGAQRVLAA